MVLLSLVLMFIANNAILFIPNVYSYYNAWIVNSVLFGLLAVLYLITFCILKLRMELISNSLEPEKQKMKHQFYFFGFAYLLKCFSYGVEIFIWQREKWFLVLLLEGIIIVFTDILPIAYIIYVHNNTFK